MEEPAPQPSPSLSSVSAPALESASQPESDPSIPMQDAPETPQLEHTSAAAESVRANRVLDGLPSRANTFAPVRPVQPRLPALPYPANAGATYLPPPPEHAESQFVSVYLFEKDSFETFEQAQSALESGDKAIFHTGNGVRWSKDKRYNDFQPKAVDSTPFFKHDELLQACATFEAALA